MAKHEIAVQLPPAAVLNKDMVVTIKANSRKVGRVTISRGGLEWYSFRWRKPTRMTWEQFDRLMHERERE